MNLQTLLAEQPGITIFGQKIYAYALIIVFGMLMAFLVISLLFKRRNMSVDLFLTFFCIGLPVAIVCTRVFYCITDGMPFKDWFAIESIRQGGLSIIGGILGGLASVITICLVKKVNFFRVGDCIVVGLLLAQAIGRWGNFANQEVYGMEVTNEALQCFPFAVYINPNGSCLDTFALTFAKWFGTSTDITGGTWHYAFFFYESFVTFTMAVVLFIHAWKNPKKPNGINTAMYFVTYGLVRSIMEPLRDPKYILGNEVQWSFVFSLLLLAFGLAMLTYLLINNKIKEGKIFGSANGEEYGIKSYIKDTKEEKAYFDKVNMMCKIYPENYEEKPEAEKKESLWEKCKTLFKKKSEKTETEENASKNEGKEETQEKEDKKI